MDKLDCIENYFSSIRAYYLFQIGKFSNDEEYKKYILDKRYINGAKVCFLSNLMLGIKEDLVDNKGNMEYQAKVFLDSLENSVDFIANKVENGYKVGNYVFPDAPTLVAIIRNKLAHGKYTIDFEHNRVVLVHKGIDIVINIDKLTSFILMAFSNSMKDINDVKYERNLLYYSMIDKNKDKKIKDLSDVRKIIKNYYSVSFAVESLNGAPVFKDCIQYLENFIKNLGNNIGNFKNTDDYKQMVEYFKMRNCKIGIEYKSLRDNKEISRILDFANKEILNNNDLDYEQKVKLIGVEVQKSINGSRNNFNALAANVGNIILINAIDEVNSVDDSVLSTYIGKIYPFGIRLGYDEFGMTLLAMFNALFIYPFDDVFDTSGEYTVNRNDAFDFSILDLSVLNPAIVTIDDAPLISSKARVDGLDNRIVELNNKINQQRQNLAKVSGKPDVITKINSNISDLNNALMLANSSYVVAKNEYDLINNDYTINRMYFYNKAVIEGIRNSIAHGHYEFNCSGDILSTEVIFRDIYEGKVTFEVKMTFEELEALIGDNYLNVLSYVSNKNNLAKKAKK